MAIQFARIEIVSRSSGGNACCKGAYNARSIIADEKTNIVYNFIKKGGNVYHQVLLPKHVDKSFTNINVLMNAIEHIERKDNSQLVKDIVIALPDDKELTLEDRINITHEIIEEMAWVKQGLAVQIDIHEPHNGENNWHVHLLVTTRRFTADGKRLSPKKARDLNPEFKTGKHGNFIIPEEDIIHERSKRIINRYFKKLGLENRVDELGKIAQEHIGPVRMRSVLNEAVIRNEERVVANIESLQNGADVIDRITRNNSVFSEKDLLRVVKCVADKDRGERLVASALSTENIIELYNEDGSKSELYTTIAIRQEEQKLLRLGGYINGQSNIALRKEVRSKLAEIKDLSAGQYAVLEHLLLSDKGLRILKGRAGTGKSHVLGRLAKIAKASKIELIGLAPTHKAKLELEKVGYERSDTVKGFLFKLHNDRVKLAKNSLMVIDEAAMVGNDDYAELLRVAVAKKCNVILAGDERQLSSMQRGGMFEVYANEFGGIELNNIRRQSVEWGREVAVAFSTGDVSDGVKILKENNRLHISKDKMSSFAELLTDWDKSAVAVEQRLIIAIKNKCVDVLNQGARELLKARGILQGKEYVVSNKDSENFASFMNGERIVFNASNKDLGISNGDFGKLECVSEHEFRVILDRGEEITFNPNEFSSFKHGYASTIYKAQGASIKDVYVLHDGFSGMKNSYVAMSRHIEDLHLYTNKIATKSEMQLIKQLSLNSEHKASLHYATKEELALKTQEQSLGVFGKIGARLGKGIERIIDQHKVNADYYDFVKPVISTARVEELLELVNEYVVSEERVLEQQQEFMLAEQAVVGSDISRQADNLTTASHIVTRSTAKERFYAKVDYQRAKATSNIDYKAAYENDVIYLRDLVRNHAETIVEHLLGEPNRILSKHGTLRYGEHGSLAVKISGTRAGSWYDFSKELGGDIFTLVQEVEGGDFKGAVRYLQDRLGVIRNSHLRLVNDNIEKDKYVDHHKQAQQQQPIEAAKIRKVEGLEARAKPISAMSVAHRYFTQTRQINCDLGADIRTTSIYDAELGKSLPAIIAFARDASGKITGGQQILLEPVTARKANVATPKKSFGKIAGAFVEIATAKQSDNQITIIAEGLETALSIKQAGIEARILCSLGVSNIKNYQAKEGEKIIIACDNDGANANSDKVIESARVTLAEHAMVAIVKPREIGDFNDILQQKENITGIEEIKAIFAPVINGFTANTLQEFFGDVEQNQQLTDKAKKDLIYINKYYIDDQPLLASFKSDHEQGMNELAKTVEKLQYAENIVFKSASYIIEELADWNVHEQEAKMVASLAVLEEKAQMSYLKTYRDNVLDKYLSSNIQQFRTAKRKVETIAAIIEIVQQEQKFLADTFQQIKEPIYVYKIENIGALFAGKVMSDQPSLLSAVKNVIDYALEHKVLPESEIAYLFKTELDMNLLLREVERKCEYHHITSNLAKFEQTKLESKSPEEMIAVVESRQEFLVGLDGNLKYANSHSDKIQEHIKQAIQQDKEQIIVSLGKLVSQALSSGTITQESILTELKQTTDLKATCTNLDKLSEAQHINSNLASFAQAKQEARTGKDLLNILADEQNFLSGLYGNLKYPEQQSHLLEPIRQAHQQRKEHIIEELYRLVQRSLKSGAKDKEQIFKELQNSTDLKATYINLDKVCEAHHIQTNLTELSQAKDLAKTPQEMLESIGKEQGFLSELHNNLKYPEAQSHLLEKIARADQQQQDKVLEDLHKSVTHIIAKEIMPADQLTKHLRENSDIGLLQKDLRKVCEDHHMQYLNQNMRKINQEKSLIINGHSFTTAIEYVQHEIAHPEHEFSNSARISRALQQMQQRIELQREKELEYSMGGRSM